MSNIKGYQGIFFDEETSKKMVELQKNPLESPVQDMHITFKFGELEEYPVELMQREVEVRLVAYGCDGKNSGFEVELPADIEAKYYKGNRPIHITVSIGTVNGEKGKPVDTAKLHFETLAEPITVIGKFGYFIFGEGKVMNNFYFES